MRTHILRSKRWETSYLSSIPLYINFDKDTYIRFIPNEHFNGNALINLRAWDGTSGEAENYDSDYPLIDSDNCEVEAYSCIDATGTITIDPVNDYPVIDNITYNTVLDQYSDSALSPNSWFY